eukprot:5163726-Lingulodinium_polyedra.AAC.1
MSHPEVRGGDILVATAWDIARNLFSKRAESMCWRVKGYPGRAVLFCSQGPAIQEEPLQRFQLDHQAYLEAAAARQASFLKHAVRSSFVCHNSGG